MVADYDVLSTVYNELGMSDFARQMAPRLLDFAQRNDWLGRQILDLGTGTGAGMQWLAQHGYIMTGIDQSNAMLTIARQYYNEDRFKVRLEEQDVRALQNIDSIDMAIAFDVLNELENLKDLEATFKSVYRVLKANKWFIFDMYTIEGLVERTRTGDKLVHEDENLTIFTNNTFDYERQTQNRRFIIYRRQPADDAWIRQEGQRILRAYPVQGLSGLLQRCGYSVEHILNTNLTPYRPGNVGTTRVIIIAQKR